MQLISFRSTDVYMSYRMFSTVSDPCLNNNSGSELRNSADRSERVKTHKTQNYVMMEKIIGLLT